MKMPRNEIELKKTPNDYRMYPFLRHNATQNGTTSEENSQRSLIMGANDVADGRKTGKKYKKEIGRSITKISNKALLYHIHILKCK